MVTRYRSRRDGLSLVRPFTTSHSPSTDSISTCLTASSSVRLIASFRRSCPAPVLMVPRWYSAWSERQGNAGTIRRRYTRRESTPKGDRGMRPFRGAGRHVACSFAVLVILTGCASLAVRPCDTIEDRDGKYFGRFFLGVATLGLSEVTIQQEEVRQAYQGSPGCPPPPGVQVVSAPNPNPAGRPSVA